MVLPRDFPSSPQLVLRLLRSHPLLVAWLTVVTGLCFATGVAVSVLFDPSASHYLSTNSRLATGASEAGIPEDGALAPPLEADGATTEDFTAAAPTTVPTDSPANAASSSARALDPSPASPAGLGQLQEDVVIIAPAPEFDPQNRNPWPFTAPAEPDRALETAPQPPTATQTSTQATLALPLGEKTIASLPFASLRVWLLGGLGLGCGLGALWVSQRLMAELKVAPTAQAGVAQGSMTVPAPVALVPSGAIEPVAAILPALPAAVPAPEQTPPAPAPQALPPHPEPVSPAAGELAPPPASPPPSGLVEEVDLRKRRSASSWFDG